MRWDSPLTTWDSGLHWDRSSHPVGMKGNRMTFKLLLGFDSLSNPDFSDKVQGIKTALTTEPALTLIPNPWPSIYPSRTEVTDSVTDFITKYEAARDGGKADRDIRDLARDALTPLLKNLAPYLESVARAAGDPSILDYTGYDRASEPEPIPQPPAAPELKLQQGPLSGLLVANATRPKGAAIFETQRCTSDPSVEANWNSTVQTTGCRRIELAGCTPGQLYFVRTRARGRGGPGPWSDIANLMVI